MNETTTADLVREALAEWANEISFHNQTDWVAGNFQDTFRLSDVFGTPKFHDFALLSSIQKKLGLKECPVWQETVGDLIAATEREPLADKPLAEAANDEGYSNYAADLAELERRALKLRVVRMEPEV